MLSYRHAFHAGNHADVLKHFLFVHLIHYLTHKPKPIWIMDTHAGAGLYALTSGYATKLSEYRTGIGQLWSREDHPPALEKYVRLVRKVNSGESLSVYPGSPWFSQSLLRKQDQLRLFERHTTESALLEKNMAGARGKVLLIAGDGFAGLRASLPPGPRRGLILIDPSYETGEDYRQVIEALRDGLKRFATGTYALWFPRLSRLEARELPYQLARLPANSWLRVTMDICAERSDGVGLFGSGMFVINPPWSLPAMLMEVMPYLVKVLGQDSGAGYDLEYEIP
jgi:23S rRNA (adenine2030-N6)-methyltransferase